MEKEERVMLVRALNDIKFSLYNSRLNSPKIKRSEFERIVDSAKFRFNQAADAIDECFKEFFPPKISFYEKENMQKEENDGNKISGPTLVKHDSHFKSRYEDPNSKAA